MFIITQNVSASTVSDWIRILTPLHVSDPNTQASLLTLLATVNEIRAERNALVHGLWREGPEPNTAIIQTIRLDRAEIIKDEFATAADLNDLIQRSTEALIEALALRDKIIGQPNP